MHEGLSSPEKGAWFARLRGHLEAPLKQWLIYWHGTGEPEQYDYYRCLGCRRLITWHLIRVGGCDCGMSNKLAPAALSLWGKFRVLVLPFTVRHG